MLWVVKFEVAEGWARLVELALALEVLQWVKKSHLAVVWYLAEFLAWQHLLAESEEDLQVSRKLEMKKVWDFEEVEAL